MYKPVQPATQLHADGVVYTEFSPDPALQPYIFAYWEFRTTKVLDDQLKYRVVPNGCIDIYFDMNDPSRNFVTGFSNRPSEQFLNTSFRYIGICFFPSMFPQIFSSNAAELSNRYEDLRSVVRETSEFISNRFEATDDLPAVKSKLDRYFIRKFSKVCFSHDPRLYAALHLIIKNAGALHVQKGLDIGISSRQQRRLFEFYLGDSPKVFSKVVRFQFVLQEALANKDRKKNAIQNGYYDQPHFVKEFKSFYGETPGKVLAQLTSVR